MIDFIIDSLNHNKGEVMQLRDWMTSSNNINGNTESFSISTDIEKINGENDIDSYIIIKKILDLTSIEIDKFITDKLVKSEFNKISYFELFDGSGSDYYTKQLPLFVEYLNSSNNQHAFCCTYIASLLQDSSFFNHKPVENVISITTVYPSPIGNVENGLNLYVDPYLRWGDTIVTLFDMIEVNISNVRFSSSDDTKILTELDITYKIHNVERILVNTDCSSDKIKSEFIEINRDKIINSIISE